jgi:uncharacterized protein (DUF433 family)
MKTNDFITIDNEIMGGRPVFKGTRVPIDGLFEYIEDGLTIDQFSEDFPSVSKQMAINVLESLKKELVGT